MPEYQLELKQVVEYPRCRIYRQFIQTLMADRSIRTRGCSGLFHYTLLCAHANFRTSYRKIGGISYTVYPGEWLCQVDELMKWFRVRLRCHALDALKELQERHYLTYSVLGRGQLVKYKITNWKKHNTVLDYNAPCQKDTGFFFLPIATAAELVSLGRCSEMDALLDMWVNTVYNDGQVLGSEAGPVVYVRNGTGSSVTDYEELGARWGLSKATVGRFLKKMEELGYLHLLTFAGTQGSAIYLKSYLSTMFQISDVMIDKDEIAMILHTTLATPPDVAETKQQSEDHHICVSNEIMSVSKQHLRLAVRKVKELLQAQGFLCFDCPKTLYRLSPLSPGWRIGSLQQLTADDRTTHRFKLEVSCDGTAEAFVFELLLSSAEKDLAGRMAR